MTLIEQDAVTGMLQLKYESNPDDTIIRTTNAAADVVAWPGDDTSNKTE